MSCSYKLVKNAVHVSVGVLGVNPTY